VVDKRVDRTVWKSERFQVVHREIELVDGSPFARDVILHPGAVAILPVFPDGRICLIRNYRLSIEQTLIELPAGTLETGEASAHCAQRELLEETGYQADSIELLCSFYMSPGILNEKMYLYLATGLTEGQPQREPGEMIENVIVSSDVVRQMIRNGEIQDAKSLAGLLYYQSLVDSRSGF